MHATMDFSQLPNEIFDIILATLHYKDLLWCELVSKTWRQLIKDGHRTCKTLFRYRKSMEEHPDPKTRLNYLDTIWNSYHASRPTEAELLADCVAHPLLTQPFLEPSSIDDGFSLEIYKHRLLDTIGSPDGHANPTASWRSMFITWPPLNEIEMQVSCLTPRHSGSLWPRMRRTETSRVVSISEGITLNHFFYTLYRCLESHPLHIGFKYAPMLEWVNMAPQEWAEQMPFLLSLEIIATIPEKKDQIVDGPKIAARIA
jgi:hypothetical protein